jgi:hypothetical protein
MQIKDQNTYTWLSLISSRRGFGQWASFLVVRGGTSFEKQFGVGVGTPISDPNGQKTNGEGSYSIQVKKKLFWSRLILYVFDVLVTPHCSGHASLAMS